MSRIIASVPCQLPSSSVSGATEICAGKRDPSARFAVRTAGDGLAGVDALDDRVDARRARSSGTTSST